FKTSFDDLGRYTYGYFIGPYIFCHHRRGPDDGPGADADSGHYDGAMADPYIMPDGAAMFPAPLKELRIIFRPQPVLGPAVGHVMLCHPPLRMIARIDP